MPVDKRALRYASVTFVPKHATSPVEAISTRNTGSVPRSLVKEKCGTFTPKYGTDITIGAPAFCPKMIFIAQSMKLNPSTFETKGKLLEARRFASITSTSGNLSSRSRTKNCILKGPLAVNSFAILSEMSFIRSRASTDNEKDGRTKVASPECTPECSTCSDIAQA